MVRRLISATPKDGIILNRIFRQLLADRAEKAFKHAETYMKLLETLPAAKLKLTPLVVGLHRSDFEIRLTSLTVQN